MDKPDLVSSSSEASSIRKSSGSEQISETIHSIRSEIPETAGFSSNLVSLDEKDNRAILSSDISEQLESTANASWGNVSLSSGVASPTKVLFRSTVDILPLSRLETSTIAQGKTENYLQSFALVTESEQHETQTLEETEGLVVRSFTLATTDIVSSSISNSRPSSSLIVTQGNKTATATATTIFKSEESSHSAILLDTANVTVQTDEDLTSLSVSAGFSKQTQNVYLQRTFSFVIPTPSATARLITRSP